MRQGLREKLCGAFCPNSLVETINIKLMEQFLIQNLWIIILFGVWSLILKGIALWKAAHNDDKWWFVALLILNTLGLLEIFYIFVFSKRKKMEKNME
jgi:hypothetical protein